MKLKKKPRVLDPPYIDLVYKISVAHANNIHTIFPPTLIGLFSVATKHHTSCRCPTMNHNLD